MSNKRLQRWASTPSSSRISGVWSVIAMNSLPGYKILHVLASCHVKICPWTRRRQTREVELERAVLLKPKLSLTSHPPLPYWRYVRSRGVPASEITWSPPSGIFQGPTLGTRSAPTDWLVARVRGWGGATLSRSGTARSIVSPRRRRGFGLRPGSMTTAGWEASSCTAVRRAEQASEYPYSWNCPSWTVLKALFFLSCGCHCWLMVTFTCERIDVSHVLGARPTEGGQRLDRHSNPRCSRIFFLLLYFIYLFIFG